MFQLPTCPLLTVTLFGTFAFETPPGAAMRGPPNGVTLVGWLFAHLAAARMASGGWT